MVNCLYYLAVKPSFSNHYTFWLNDKWNDYPSFHFKTLQQEENHTIHKFCYSALAWTCVFECQFRAPFKSIHNLNTHLPLKREVKVAILPNQAICYLFNLSFISFNNYVESDVNKQPPTPSPTTKITTTRLLASLFYLKFSCIANISTRSDIPLMNQTSNKKPQTYISLDKRISSLLNFNLL